MSQVSVTINGRQFRMACEDGQEDHLDRTLPASSTGGSSGLRAKFGEIGDTRLTVMAALTVADELAEAGQRVKRLEEELAAPAGRPRRGRRSQQSRAGRDRRRAGRRRRAHRERSPRNSIRRIGEQRRRAGLVRTVASLRCVARIDARGDHRRISSGHAPRHSLHCRSGAAWCVGDNSSGPYDPEGSCPWPGSWVRSHGAHLLM